MFIKKPYEASWEDLSRYVEYIRENSHRSVWELIREEPFDFEAIDDLIRYNFELKFYAGLSDGNVYFQSRDNDRRDGGIIYLNSNLKGYLRDKVFFHELVHAHYGDELSDAVKKTPELQNHNNAIVEWLARHHRTNPILLRHALLSYGLDIQIYDLSSFHALYDPYETNQILFPFCCEQIEMIILRD